MAKSPAKASAKSATAKSASKSSAPKKAAAKSAPKAVVKKPAKTAVKAATSKAAGKATGKTASKKAAGKTKKYVDPNAPRPGNPLRHPGHSSGHKGISRVDHLKRNTHGWLVRVAWMGEMHVKFYSDGAHGGKEAALQKAIVYRNRLEKQLGKPRTDRTVMVHHQRSGTGVLGVHRTIKEGAEVYEVTWSPEPNVVRRTSVSIRKYGEDEAFRRARAIRRKKEKEVFGTYLRAPQTS